MAAMRVSDAQWALLQGERLPDQPRARKPRASLPENQLEKQICDFCVVRGWLPIRIQAGVFKSLDGKRHISGAPKGTPDWVFIRRNTAMLVEMKSLRGKASKPQLDFALQAVALKLAYYMPRTLEQFMEFYYATWKDLR